MTSLSEANKGLQNRSADNTFTGLRIDRAARRRRDPEWVAAQMEAPTTRFLPVWDSKVLTTDESVPQPVWLTPEMARGHLARTASVVLLGEEAGRTYFALRVREGQPSPPAELTALGVFRSLRALAPLLDPDTAGLLAYAKAMIHYHVQHRFCARCGSPTVSREGGHLRVCADTECGQHDFPRTDPAIIVLVSSGDHCLLGRQPTWPETLYSTIAGFVEPGESLEAAVAREVREETGVGVDKVRYHSSQPWPFPRSLMIGFMAAAEQTTIRLHDGELEEARWVSRDEITRQVKEGTLRLPSPISISHRLIETWFDAEGDRSLSTILTST